ncbi:hypothetical protein AWM70_10790 [Paenibacillus yonginensis]|uniref:Uncharacterized protein n=1 Tax=Paenibacillus yonginensis TaxID=1462996 RepID=A0A1B1N0R6_9BACL|nr:hypothetical protein AWM70_10790 [Paenibacillus yonginensis]
MSKFLIAENGNLSSLLVYPSSQGLSDKTGTAFLPMYFFPFHNRLNLLKDALMLPCYYQLTPNLNPPV